MAIRPTVLPPQGTPGRFDPRNPTLIPNFDRNSVKGADNSMPPTVNHASPAGFLAANPRTNATAVATIGGSVTTGDEVTLVLTNPTFPGGLISHAYTTVGGDTLDTVADALADLFNDDPVAAGADIELDVAGAVITINHGGPIGNFTVASAPISEPSTITVGGTARTGDTINVLFTGPQFGAGVLASFNTVTGNTTTQSAAGLAAAINANATLAALGVTAAPSTNTIVLTVPAAVEPATVSVWANTITTTATIVGTAATGDTLNLTFTNAAIAGSPLTVTYVALGGESATALATALTALINGNAALIAAGVTATSALGVITFAYQAINGSIRYAQSVSPGSETITLIAAPTETIALATNATETVVFTPSNGALSGGLGPVFASNNFEFAPSNGGISAFFFGAPYEVGYDVLAQMVAQGMPIV